MPAFVIARVTVRDPELMSRYAEAAGATFKAHGGRMLLRGGFAEALIGESDPHAAGIIEFPDLAALKRWFASDEYQALAELRDSACDMQMLAYETPPA